MLGRQDVLKFGKHRGEKIQKILLSDPGYLVWAYDTIDFFFLPPGLISEARWRKQASRVPFRSWNNDYDYDYDDPMDAIARDAAWGNDD
jgi:hypothetical protein